MADPAVTRHPTRHCPWRRMLGRLRAVVLCVCHRTFRRGRDLLRTSDYAQLTTTQIHSPSVSRSRMEILRSLHR